MLVGSRRIWFSEECTVLVTDTEPGAREEFVTGRLALARKENRSWIRDPIAGDLITCLIWGGCCHPSCSLPSLTSPNWEHGKVEKPSGSWRA